MNLFYTGRIQTRVIVLLLSNPSPCEYEDNTAVADASTGRRALVRNPLNILSSVPFLILGVFIIEIPQLSLKSDELI